MRQGSFVLVSYRQRCVTDRDDHISALCVFVGAPDALGFKPLICCENRHLLFSSSTIYVCLQPNPISDRDETRLWLKRISSSQELGAGLQYWIAACSGARARNR